MKIKCASCGADLDDKSVIFECPKCNKKIARCNKCRKLNIKYTCACGFEGP
ncbi:MAG: RNA-binding protein [archaeon]|nr:MAG: RNA-binding protein [archaeon]